MKRFSCCQPLLCSPSSLPPQFGRNPEAESWAQGSRRPVKRPLCLGLEENLASSYRRGLSEPCLLVWPCLSQELNFHPWNWAHRNRDGKCQLLSFFFWRVTSQGWHTMLLQRLCPLSFYLWTLSPLKSMIFLSCPGHGCFALILGIEIARDDSAVVCTTCPSRGPDGDSQVSVTTVSEEL